MLGTALSAPGPGLSLNLPKAASICVLCKENFMVTIARFCKVGFHRFLSGYAVAATFSLLLLTAVSALGQTDAKKPVKPETKKEQGGADAQKR
jgi:hypothetical protein